MRGGSVRFTNAGLTIAAELSFAATGELIGFWSDDRDRLAADGSFERLRWSTPFGAYRPFGPVRLPSWGEARWHEPAGDYAYVELTIDDVRYNVSPV